MTVQHPRLSVKMSSQVFYPHSFTPQRKVQKNKSDTLALRTHWPGRRGLSAVPSKARASHPGSERLYTKPSEPTDELCEPKRSTATSPTCQRRPNEWQTHGKAVPFTKSQPYLNKLNSFLNKQRLRNEFWDQSTNG